MKEEKSATDDLLSLVQEKHGILPPVVFSLIGEVHEEKIEESLVEMFSLHHDIVE